MKETKLGTYIRNDETYNFNFSTNLSTADKLKFVQSVVSLVVGDDNYNSIIRDLITDFYIINIFTDVDTAEIWESLNFIDDAEQFLDETNIVDIVKANVDDGLLDELNEAIDLDIRYKTGIHPSPIADSLASLINTLEKKINEIDLNSAMEMAQKFSGMTGEFNLDNLVNAYMNSDLHQKNLDEIAENKKSKKNKNGKKNEIKIDENLGEAIRTVVKENKAEKSES